MKQKISYSRYVSILTALLFGIVFIACIATVHEKPLFFAILAVYLVLIVTALFFGVAYLKATPDYIILGSILRSKKIRVIDIESVELFQPTMGAVRILGSGGFMGYWGIFKEGDIGRYYAFYGKASDCFLVRLRNGDKYLLGCKDPASMLSYLRPHLN